MMSRLCKNWLHTLSEYVEETESPRHFWAWAGIYALTSALERKCWLPFGMETIYPNLFVMLIAPPGRCRKGSPAGFVKKILLDIGVNVFVDSASKRALTQEMDKISKNHACSFKILDPEGIEIYQSQCPICLVSKELSSFFAVNLKEMVELLTDLFDSHDKWDYKTSGKGEDCIHGVCLSAFFASTPRWVARNLPEGSIGDGFTSRFVVVYGDEKYKAVPIPPPPPAVLYRKLTDDLSRIKQLSGEFKFSPEAERMFRGWYGRIQKKAKKTFDERIGVFLEREHVIAIKTAMGLHVAYSDTLTIEVQDIKQAIALVEEIEASIPIAFGGHGRAEIAQGMNSVSYQLRIMKKATMGELLRLNYNNLTRPELVEIIHSLRTMGQVETESFIGRGGKTVERYIWLGKEGVKGTI